MSIHRSRRFAIWMTLVITVAGVLVNVVLAAKPAAAADGTILRTITAQSPACSVGTGIGFDGTQLLLDCHGSNQVWGVSPADGSLLHTYTINGVNDLGAMAWDRARGKLWACSGDYDVYLADLVTQTATFAFTSQGCFDGLAYDGTDDTLWASADVSPSVQHYKSDGTLLNSIDVSAALGGCGNSGIAVGGSKLLLSNDGCSQIYIAPKIDPASATLFGTYPARLEDMECDDLTFSGQGKAAIWSKDAYDNTLNAFELNPGTCGFGGQPPGPGSSAVVDPVVSNQNTTLTNNPREGGAEPTIAVNPRNPSQIVILAANVSTSTTWQHNGQKAALFYSSDGGHSWVFVHAIPNPPGRRVIGCPCDTTADWGADGTLYVSVLAATEDRQGSRDVFTASNSGDPTQPADWQWRKRHLIAQATNQVARTADQPWVITNPSPSGQAVNAYVAYDAFDAGQANTNYQSLSLRVAESSGITPPDFTRDTSPGDAFVTQNPALRIAGDKSHGVLVAFHQDSIPGAQGTTTYVYRLNRSTDGGKTWQISGRAQGLTVDRVKVQTKHTPPIETFNRTQGDLAVAVGRDDSVFVAYAIDSQGKGYRDALGVRRLVPNGGGYSVGPLTVIASGVSTQLPGLAVLDNGTVGVLYDSLDGTDSAGHAKLSTHLAVSKDQATTFSDSVLVSFVLSGSHSALPYNRPLGDYSQLKAVGNSFYGTFTGSRGAISSTTMQPSRLDPLFFTLAP